MKKIPFIEPFLKVHLIPAGVKRERNKDGSIPDGWIEKINRHSHSPVRNWYNWHFYLCSGAADGSTFGDGYLAVKTIANVVTATSVCMQTSAPTTQGFSGPVGTSSYGIQVGTGNPGESIDNYVLSALIAHGVGGGQLQYALQQLTNLWVTNGTDYYSAERERVFNNGSGGTINVVESGLVGYAGIYSVYVMAMRDEFAQIAVANGEGLAVSYDLRVNFPDLRT